MTSLRIIHQYVWTSQKKFFDAHPERLPESKFWMSVQKTNFNDRPHKEFRRLSKQRISATIQMKNFGDRPNKEFRRPSKRRILTTIQTKNFDNRPSKFFDARSRQSFSMTIQNTIPSTPLHDPHRASRTIHMEHLPRQYFFCTR